MRWRLWLGDGLLERFGLTPESVVTEASNPRLQALKQDLLADAKPHLAEGVYHRSIDAAVTSLIEAMDQAQSSPKRD